MKILVKIFIYYQCFSLIIGGLFGLYTFLVNNSILGTILSMFLLLIGYLLFLYLHEKDFKWTFLSFPYKTSKLIKYFQIPLISYMLGATLVNNYSVTSFIIAAIDTFIIIYLIINVEGIRYLLYYKKSIEEGVISYALSEGDCIFEQSLYKKSSGDYIIRNIIRNMLTELYMCSPKYISQDDILFRAQLLGGSATNYWDKNLERCTFTSKLIALYKRGMLSEALEEFERTNI